MGFVTRQGSGNPHTAILARAMGIPAINSIAVKEEWNGKTVVIGGEARKFLVDLDEEILEYMENRHGEELNQKKRFQEIREKKRLRHQEENPAMGCQANHICLEEPEIFKTQLGAILRASMFDNRCKTCCGNF